MAKKQVNSSKAYRQFSVAAKKAIVKEIDKGLSKIEASRKHQVSLTSIYKWLDLYSTKYEKSKKVIVQSVEESESYLELNAKIDQLYNLLGRSQTEVMFLNKLIELASQELDVDLKKSFANKLSVISNPKKTK